MFMNHVSRMTAKYNIEYNKVLAYKLIQNCILKKLYNFLCAKKQLNTSYLAEDMQLYNTSQINVKDIHILSKSLKQIYVERKCVVCNCWA
jgi:hypothetical protein